VAFVPSFLDMAVELIVDPIRRHTDKRGPEERDAGCAEDERKAVGPPRVGENLRAAELDPRGGEGEGRTDERRERAPPRKSQKAATRAPQEGHAIALSRMLTRPIRDVWRATPRARIVRIGLNGEPFPYAAGQAVRIATHGDSTRKPFSIAAAPEDALRDDCIELLIGVDADGGAGAHLTLEPGALVDVEGPLGSFIFPHEPAEQRFVFIAGGTGIAPLRAMLRHALRLPHRDIGLLYSARGPDEFAYQQEFHALARDHRIELRQTITRAADGEWTGGRGRFGRGDIAPLVHDPATLCFICGPATLVDGTRKLLEELGVKPERIRIEEW
jgi:ferredoxin-NADP reductase